MGSLSVVECRRHRRPSGRVVVRVPRRACTSTATYLTELDSAIGDADHGTNLIRGMDAVMAAVGPTGRGGPGDDR